MNQERGSTVVANGGRGSTVVQTKKEARQDYNDQNEQYSQDGYEGESYYGESEETVTEIVGEDVIELESENDVEQQLQE